MENKTRQKIVLAALLHDIGKFWQRGDESLGSISNKLSKDSKALAGYICPINKHGGFGYQHVIWTNEFLVKYIPKSLGFHPNTFDAENRSEDNIFNLAAYHHKPNSKLQAIITLADWWSSGIDRRKESTLETEESTVNEKINWGKKRYKKRPLNSIFNIINKEQDDPKGIAGFSLSALSIQEDVFPKQIKTQDDALSQKDYTNHWNLFVDEVKLLPTDKPEAYIESLIYLLRKYTWCIPASTNDMANVSLFEHLKTTAAIADCLYVYSQEHEKAFQWDGTRISLTENHAPVLLVGVDISGIQKFIYNISKRQAAKSLKGRSFYLQLLADSLIRQIIKNCQVTQAHVLYASGGNFYMLLPNTDKVKANLTKIRDNTEKELWTDHRGTLSLNMDWVPFAFNQDQNQNQDQVQRILIEGNKEGKLGDLWNTLINKIAIKKQQKFKSILNNGFENDAGEIQSLFEVIKDGGNTETCAVSGIELKKGKSKRIDGDDELTVTDVVFAQTEIGKVLKEADYIIEYKGKDESTYLNNRSHSHINVAGTDFYLFDQGELTENEAEFRNSITSADVSLIKQFNRPNKFLLAQLKGQGVSYGFQFYGGNKQALKEDGRTAKTFEEFAKLENGNSTYLGILRMDIDGLGKIFIDGIPDEDKSFAAYATLSAYLDWFFSGYLNTIRGNSKYKLGSTEFNFRDWVNILYSGGDDVFAVGRWQEIIAFAEAIEKEFKAFTLRPDITISGGIAFVRQKFPISKAADMAGEAEHMSKEFKLSKNTSKADKNAITFFGQTVSWDKEFDEVKRLKNEFVLLSDKTNSRGFLHQIMRYKSLKDNDDLSYIWKASYYFKRFSEQYGKKAGQKIPNGKWRIPIIEEIKDNLFKGYDEVNNQRYFDFIVLAARWAEMELKFFKS